MKILRFILKGDHAFFKKPDVNEFVYFTYSNIHKVALMGIFGSILGLKGYNQQDKEKDIYPEFYEKLENLQVSIVPMSKSSNMFAKKIQTYTNTVGYANKDGTLIVKEQWIENPAWEIYVKVDDEISEKLADYILNRKAVFLPYLGKNDHFARIEGAEMLKDIDSVTNLKSVKTLACLFMNDIVTLSGEYSEDEDNDELPYKYTESLPYALEENTNLYELSKFTYTNMEIEHLEIDEVYNIEGKNIVFY